MEPSIDKKRPSRDASAACVPGRVHQALLERGSSVNGWAASHGYPKSNVYRVIAEWIEHPQRRGRLPLGGLGREIVTALRAELGPELVPLAADDGTRRTVLERAA